MSLSVWWVSLRGCCRRGEPHSMCCLLKGGVAELRRKGKTLEEEMNYFKICIEQIRQDSLLTSAVSSPLIFIGLCWSEINAESTVRCKSCRLLHKQDTAEQNKFFPEDILCPPVCQDHTNTVELLLSQMLLSELLMGQNQRPSSARDTGWIMD